MCNLFHVSVNNSISISTSNSTRTYFKNRKLLSGKVGEDEKEDLRGPSYLMKRNMSSRALSAKVKFIYHKILWIAVFHRKCGALKVDPHSKR